MEGKDKSNTRGSRGQSFPTLALPEAVKIITQAGSVSQDLTLSSLAQYAGHSTSTSGPFKQKLAALKDWGFVTKPKDGNLSLTERAMLIALPETDEKATIAMREAFLASPGFGKFYNDSAKNIELSRINMANSAVHTHGVAIKAKDKFVKTFIKSASAVGLAESIGKDRVRIHPITSAPAEPVAEQSKDDIVDAQSATTRISSIQVAHGAPVMQQSWEFSKGTISLAIHSSSALGLEAFQELPKVIGSIQDLVQVLGVKDDESVSS